MDWTRPLKFQGHETSADSFRSFELFAGYDDGENVSDGGLQDAFDIHTNVVAVKTEEQWWCADNWLVDLNLPIFRQGNWIFG